MGDFSFKEIGQIFNKNEKLKRTQPEEMKIVYAIYHLDANGEIVSE